MNIRKLPIKYNYSNVSNRKIEYIVIHDTGNKSKGAGAYAHYRYFNGDNRGASAHYFVDSKEIVQTVDDKYAAWHCGDGRGKYGIKNANSIGIEICVNPDSNYDIAVDKTVELVRYLMEKYDLPPERVVRHYDASRKTCPASMKANDWQAWKEFKRRLKEEPEGVRVNIGGKIMYLDGVFQNDRNYVSIREVAEALGHKVLWDKATQTVVIK